MAGNPYLWSTTAATNASADPDINFAEGQAPGSVNDSDRALMAGVAGWLKDTNATLTTAGSANAYTVTSNITLAALATGIRLRLKANFTNTAAATLNLSPAVGVAFGAKAIRIVSGGADAAVPAGAIQNNGIYDFNYDSTANAAAGAWILLNTETTVVVQTFTGSGTYTPTTGMKYCVLECIGGGGGGGGAGGVVGQNYAGGGGGSGSYSRKVSTAATIGASQVVTIGAAGAGGSVGPTNGGAGGDTSVGSLCIGKGGSGGKLSEPAGSAIGTGGAGGVAGTGDVVAAGAPGGNGIYSATAAVSASGPGGSSVYGGGGVGVWVASAATTGTAASNYGSGGAGGMGANIGSNAAGGAGSAGVVIITEYV